MSFALPQFMQSPWNNLVWTAIDNETDTRTSLIIYNGAANTLPTDTGQYEVNCIMMHQAEKQLYSNIGTIDVPSWAPFGPGSAFPQPLVPGTFLFTDGATVYWATSLVGQVQYNASNLNTYGILNFNDLLVASNDVPNSRINVDLDVVNLASNTSFINSLLANNTFISGISTALLALSSFITNLVSTLLSNTTFISGITNIVNTSTSTSINLSSQVTGVLPVANIDVVGIANDSSFLAALIPNLDENVKVAVDGITVTGDGTTGNPLVAVGGGGTGVIITPIYGTNIADHKYVGYPAAASNLDQSVNNTTITGDNVFFFSFPMGDRTAYRYSQIFTTGAGDGFATQQLATIQLYSTEQYTSKSCEIDIYAESGGLPTGSSLGTLSGTFTNGGGIGGYWSLTGTPITLNSSTNYCFVLKILTINNSTFNAAGNGSVTVAQVSTNSGVSYSAASYGFNYKIQLYNPLDLDKVYEIISGSPAMVYAGYTTTSGTAGNAGNVQINGLLSGFTGLTLGTQVVKTRNVGHAISSTQVMIVQPPVL